MGWIRRDHSETVWVDVGTFPHAIGMDTAVTQELSKALKANPEAARVGVHWVVLGSHKGPLPFYLSYDRRDSTLHEMSFNSGLDSEIIFVNTNEAAVHGVAARNSKATSVTGYGARLTRQPGLFTRLKQRLGIR